MHDELSEANPGLVLYVSDDDPYFHKDPVCPSRMGGLYIMRREYAMKGASYKPCPDCFRD